MIDGRGRIIGPDSTADISHIYVIRFYCSRLPICVNCQSSEKHTQLRIKTMGNSVAYLESRYMQVIFNITRGYRLKRYLQLHRSLNSYGKIGLAVGTATAAVNVGAGAGVTVMFLGYESKTEGEMDLTQQIGAIPVVFGGLAVCSVLKGAAFGAAWPVTLFSMWPRYENTRIDTGCC